MPNEATYFDLQLNGYGGVDFNSPDLDADGLHRACERLDRDGVGGFLATIITDTIDVMSQKLAKIVALRDRDPLAQRMIPGIHIEGPFLNEVPGYRGAHPVDAIHPTDLDELKRLLDAAGGLTRYFTLAPDRDPDFRATRLLVKQRIVVAAGHTDASLDQLKGAIDAGLSAFTHLGNGCPMQMHRHDNIITRALSLHEKLWLCFIADGTHVPFFVLRTWLRAIGLERVAFVTDAVAPAGLGPGRYNVSRWDVLVCDDMVVRAPDGSHFIGAAITMKQTEENLREKVGLSEADAHRLLCDHPRRVVGL
jgi:N-acetylglucosamine-6-phosphate deacetylase